MLNVCCTVANSNTLTLVEQRRDRHFARGLLWPDLGHWLWLVGGFVIHVLSAIWYKKRRANRVAVVVNSANESLIGHSKVAPYGSTN